MSKHPHSKGERYYWGQHIYNNYPNIDPNYIGSSTKIKEYRLYVL